MDMGGLWSSGLYINLMLGMSTFQIPPSTPFFCKFLNGWLGRSNTDEEFESAKVEKIKAMPWSHRQETLNQRISKVNKIHVNHKELCICL